MNTVLKAVRRNFSPAIVTTPIHRHDCVKCEFLGTTHEIDKYRYDLYYCEQDGNYPTFIARYGNHEKYVSGFGFITSHPALALAFTRKIVKDYS